MTGRLFDLPDATCPACARPTHGHGLCASCRRAGIQAPRLDFTAPAEPLEALEPLEDEPAGPERPCADCSRTFQVDLAGCYPTTELHCWSCARRHGHLPRGQRVDFTGRDLNQLDREWIALRAELDDDHADHSRHPVGTDGWNRDRYAHAVGKALADENPGAGWIVNRAPTERHQLNAALHIMRRAYAAQAGPHQADHARWLWSYGHGHSCPCDLCEATGHPYQPDTGQAQNAAHLAASRMFPQPEPQPKRGGRRPQPPTTDRPTTSETTDAPTPALALF
ncbi:MAG: hypothetical protein AB7G37_06385 [Solirubrobacteraceae bacterium]